MSVLNVTWLDLLHELCLQNGWALLLTATHSHPGFAKARRTQLVNLDVFKPGVGRGRRRLIGGELIVRCDLQAVNGDLQAAAELLVGLLTHTQEQAA